MPKIALGDNVRQSLIDHFQDIPEASGNGATAIGQLEQKFNDFIDTLKSPENKGKISAADKAAIFDMVRDKAQRVMDLPGAKGTQYYQHATRLRDRCQSREESKLESTVRPKQGEGKSTEFLTVEQLFWQLLRDFQAKLDKSKESQKENNSEAQSDKSHSETKESESNSKPNVEGALALGDRNPEQAEASLRVASKERESRCAAADTDTPMDAQPAAVVDSNEDAKMSFRGSNS